MAGVWGKLWQCEGCSRKTPFFTILLSLTTIYCRFVIGHRTQQRPDWGFICSCFSFSYFFFFHFFHFSSNSSFIHMFVIQLYVIFVCRFHSVVVEQFGVKCETVECAEWWLVSGERPISGHRMPFCSLFNFVFFYFLFRIPFLCIVRSFFFPFFFCL